MDRGQHWFGWWFVAWRHQSITWTNVNFALVKFCDVYLRAISQWVSKLLISIISLDVNLLKLLPHLPGTNKWRKWPWATDCDDDRRKCRTAHRSIVWDRPIYCWVRLTSVLVHFPWLNHTDQLPTLTKSHDRQPDLVTENVTTVELLI